MEYQVESTLLMTFNGGHALLILAGAIQLAEVRRASSGPGLWPGPRRQARWGGRGLRGQGWPGLWAIALATRRRRALDAGGADPDNARRSGR
jgi:hypothetical protein